LAWRRRAGRRGNASATARPLPRARPRDPRRLGRARAPRLAARAPAAAARRPEAVTEERLTEKQAEALQSELAELEGPRRTEVVAAIKKAREFGDLSENFEYHAAKNEQGILEARIRRLRARLDHAEIVGDAAGDEVGIGSVVEIEDEGGETM